jgi:hypothetical protein
MASPDLSDIEGNAEPIVQAIGREAVDVYVFLSDEFASGSVVENYVFQFTYRSFYRLDNAGLTPELKTKYFALMEESRNSAPVDLRKLAKDFYALPNRKGQQSLLFSFVTKLANTVNREYPIYDAEVASVFGFRAPYNYKTCEVRLDEYMTFYSRLRKIYADILSGNRLAEARRMFRQLYAAPPGRIPDIKVLDFIFWSAGKLSYEAEQE